MHGDENIDRPDEFVTNLMESEATFRVNFVRITSVVLKSHSQSVFGLKLI